MQETHEVHSNMNEMGPEILVVTGLLAVGAAFALYFISQYRERRQILTKVFRSRKPLNAFEFYQSYFRAADIPPDIVNIIRQILQEETGIDMSRLRPTDDLTGDLGLVIDHYDLVEAVIRMEEEFDIKITDDEAAAMKTFEDMVMFVWRRKRKQ